MKNSKIALIIGGVVTTAISVSFLDTSKQLLFPLLGIMIGIFITFRGLE